MVICSNQAFIYVPFFHWKISYSLHFLPQLARLQPMTLLFQQKPTKDPSSVTYSSTEKPLEPLRGDSCISQGQAPNECQLGSPSIPECSCVHSSLIILPFLHLTCPTNQKHKSLIEPCFLPILNPSVKLLENQLNSVAPFYMK